MKNSHISLLIACLGTTLVTGCAKYNPQPLGIPSAEIQEKKGLAVRAKLLRDQDEKTLFGGLSPEDEGYNTIHLTVTNNTDQSYLLDANKMNLELAPTDSVAEKIGFSPMTRILAYGVPGLFIWPFLIPACVDGVKADNANKKIKHDFSVRAIDRGATVHIRPHSTMNKVVFVAGEHLQPTFEFDLNNQVTGAAEEFSINL